MVIKIAKHCICLFFIFIVMANIISLYNSQAGQKECVLEQKINVLNEKLTAKELEINKLKNHIEFQEGMIDQYNNMFEKVISFSSIEELDIIAESAWEYELLVDGKPVPGDGYIEINVADFKVEVREKTPPYSLYLKHSELFKDGRLTDYEVKVITEEKLYKKIAAAGTVVDVPIVYIFKGVVQGDIVKLNISDNLKERLELDTSQIKIKAVE